MVALDDSAATAAGADVEAAVREVVVDPEQPRPGSPGRTVAASQDAGTVRANCARRSASRIAFSQSHTSRANASATAATARQSAARTSLSFTLPSASR